MTLMHIREKKQSAEKLLQKKEKYENIYFRITCNDKM